MSYKYSFADNEIYSANDLNAITKRLVTAGVEDSFSDGVAYNVSRFNEAGKLLYTSGVVPQTCLTLKVQSAGENKILINPGVAFFNDGSVIEVEAGGETLEFVIGLKNYVYLKNDLLNTNMCYPCCTTDEPSGDYVLLAEIDEEGNIADKRTYAKGKLPGYESVVGNVMRLHETIDVTVESQTDYISGSASFNIGANNFEYILVYREYEPYKNYIGAQLPCLGIYDIANKKYRSFCATSYTNSNISGVHFTGMISNENNIVSQYMSSAEDTSLKEMNISFELENGVLNVLFQIYARNRFMPGTHSFDIDLILF